MRNPNTSYGSHLTLRLANIERTDALEGAANIADLLMTLVHRIGMRILAGPMTAEESGIPEKRGWSGVVILYESHAAIHTYPELGEAFLDVFSCCPYEVKEITRFLGELFGSFTVVEQTVFDRGIHWGPNVESELTSWVTSRNG